MSVFVDIGPQVDSSATAAPTGKWLSRLIPATVPPLLLISSSWSGNSSPRIWNQTFVPYPSTVWRAFLEVSTTHCEARGYGGYLL